MSPSATVTCVAVLVVALLGVWWWGTTHPAARSAISTDQLGPPRGAPISDYLNQSRLSLASATDVESLRWALVSFRSSLHDEAAWHIVDSQSPSQVIVHVPIDGVSTPASVQPVTPSSLSLRSARANAAAEVEAAVDTDVQSRSTRVAAVVARRIQANCACIVGFVIRARIASLRDIAQNQQVRAVQALPRDAAGGRFAVVPLLPETTRVADPQDDSAAVPVR